MGEDHPQDHPQDHHQDLTHHELGYFSDEDEGTSFDLVASNDSQGKLGGEVADTEANRRALCWSVLAMAMSIPALIGA